MQIKDSGKLYSNFRRGFFSILREYTKVIVRDFRLAVVIADFREFAVLQ